MIKITVLQNYVCLNFSKGKGGRGKEEIVARARKEMKVL